MKKLFTFVIFIAAAYGLYYLISRNHDFFRNLSLRDNSVHINMPSP